MSSFNLIKSLKKYLSSDKIISYTCYTESSYDSDIIGQCKDDIDYINAHGTSTQANDKNETTAIKTLFGAKAYEVDISSTKSMTGHLLGGAGAFESMVCVLSLQEGVIPPTINLMNPDEGTSEFDLVPNKSKQKKN